ncbi:hypothetical protein C2E23DRAFT_813550 [Lenzites betulinus]|nr:hypothetical protein C2E23DRAFT_813550 [Lenzites betulinus]
MFSFSTVTLFATLALSAVTSALPLASRDLPLPALDSLPVGGVVTTVSGVTGDLPLVGSVLSGVGRRADASTSLAAILTNAQSQLAPVLAEFHFATKQNATVDALTAPVNEVKAILTATIASVKNLAGLPVETILADVDGVATITVDGLATIVADLLVVVFDALGAVLAIVDSAVLPLVITLLASVGALVGELLAAVLALVGSVLTGLLAAIVPLLSTIIPFVEYLNVAEILSLIGA